MKATALLTNWKRRENLPKIIEALRAQTHPVEIFLWDNSGIGEFRRDVDLEIVSSENLKCFPRWSMAQFASTDYVFTLDDDLIPTDPELIENCARQVGASADAIGKEGVTIIPGEGYFGSIHIGANSSAVSSVDILKGRFIFARRDTILAALADHLPHVSPTPKSPRIEDDLIISSSIRGQKIIPSFLHGAFRELPDHGVGEYRQPEHRVSREQTFSDYFEP